MHIYIYYIYIYTYGFASKVGKPFNTGALLSLTPPSLIPLGARLKQLQHGSPAFTGFTGAGFCLAGLGGGLGLERSRGVSSVRLPGAARLPCPCASSANPWKKWRTYVQ